MWNQLLSPEKHPIANALHLELDTQGLRRCSQPSPYSNWRFSFARGQATCFSCGDLPDIALVLLEPSEGRTDCRPPAAGLLSRHATESWHEDPHLRDANAVRVEGEYNHQALGRKEPVLSLKKCPRSDDGGSVRRVGEQAARTDTERSTYCNDLYICNEPLPVLDLGNR